jgi:UDP-GlcNAc:undecaprenyl-phosphate GlcNAc-1-phosphate transferase
VESLELPLIFFVAVLISMVSTPAVRRLSHALGMLDHAGPHKTHTVSRPRVGGIAVAAGWIAAIVGATWLAGARLGSLAEPPFGPILLGGVMLFVTGLWDDLRPLPPWPKLLAQVLAAAIVVRSGVTIERVTFAETTIHLGVMAEAATVVWIVTITNAFNLVDGLDGLATGLAIIAGVTCATIVVMRGEYATAVILVALVGGLIGFLPFNFNPATILLGDSGSLLIGFVLAVSAITGWQKGATALAVGVPLLIFALPILDTLSAVLRRAFARNRHGTPSGFRAILRPDRRHIHHRLMSRGLSHRDAVLVLYAVAICLSGIALLTMERS